MSLSCNPNNAHLRLLRHQHFACSSTVPPSSAAVASKYIGVDRVTQPNNHAAHLQSFEGTTERIKKLFNNDIHLSVSSYDTAWVAMLPSPNHSDSPCFPQSLHWLLHNQQHDGSWPTHSLQLIKDALSSTLASILALKRWGVGEQQIHKGLQFIEMNFASASDKDQHSPIGFDIIFPGMLDYAKTLHFNLHLEPSCLNAMLRKRESQLKRYYASHSPESQSYLAYVSEGLGNSQDWKMVMKYQMKNGSILNSPSTTAAALAHHHDAGCLDYLVSLLDNFGDAVPTVYPLDLYVRLCMVDNLQRLGIGRHFRVEIQSILDETYRCWLQEDEQIFSDVATCALAFRVLRMNSYDVSSDQLSEIANEGGCFSSLGEHSKDLNVALEVYRASQLIIYQDESALAEQNSKFGHYLKKKISDTSCLSSDGFIKHINQEVDDTLKFPFEVALERMANRRYIENYNVENSGILKTCYWSLNINNKDFLKLAVEDYNTCQSIYREELAYIERWVIENKLDELKFARQKAAYNYFSVAATLFSPELFDARMSLAKNGILATIVDDFFDVGGSMEELVNLIQLVEKWDVNIDKECCSEHVGIIFLALKRMISEIGQDAIKWQGKSVTSHIIEIWLNMLNTMLKEAVWAKDGWIPKLEEYMANSSVSFGLETIILPSLYLVGPKLSEEVVRSGECGNLFKLLSTAGRLLNDIQSFEREMKQGKLNAVTLQILHSNGEVSKEEVVEKIKICIARERRELLRLVLQEKGSLVPRACKELFWNMNQILNLFYTNGDGYTSLDMMNVVKSFFHDPISIPVDSA